MKDRIMIIGAGGHGKVVADIARLNGYKEILFLDDDISRKTNGRYQVVGTSNDIDRYKEEYDFFVAVGGNDMRERITVKLSEMNIEQPILIHPSATVDETAKIGEGTVIMANAVINADSKIGRGCIINTSATVDHDCIIDDYVHISPGVHIAGGVQIGRKTWIGAGSTVINNVTVCEQCIVGAGSVVIKDIGECGTYVGSPARKVGNKY
jgi:sugar O-acyltransferase (sialic acid O-acetyltransferase NeuD family)